MLKKIRRSFENAVFCMIVACLLFSIMGAAVKVALQSVPVYEAVFFRSIISVVLVGSLIFVRKDSFIGNRPLLLLGRGFAGFVALNLNFYAISKISLGDAAILNQTSPLFVALFSALFLGEKLSKTLIALSLISFGGVALIIKPTFAHFNYAYLVGLFGGIVAAIAYLTISHLHETDSSFTMAFYFTGISSLFTTPLMIHKAIFPQHTVLICLLIAGFTGAFAQLFITQAYKNEHASWVSPFSYSSVLFSFILGMIYFQEVPDWYSVLGSLIVMISCILLILTRHPKNKAEETIEVLE